MNTLSLWYVAVGSLLVMDLCPRLDNSRCVVPKTNTLDVLNEFCWNVVFYGLNGLQNENNVFHIINIFRIETDFYCKLSSRIIFVFYIKKKKINVDLLFLYSNSFFLITYYIISIVLLILFCYVYKYRSNHKLSKIFCDINHGDVTE